MTTTKERGGWGTPYAIIFALLTLAFFSVSYAYGLGTREWSGNGFLSKGVDSLPFETYVNLISGDRSSAFGIT